MPPKIINFIHLVLKKIVVLFMILFCFATLQSNGQTMSKQDSLLLQLEIKRKADSTRISFRKIALKKRQDSMAVVIKERQAERMRRADSTRKAKKQVRELIRQKEKEYQLRKKTREQIRDSITAVSKKATAARKAYRKNQKKKSNKIKSAHLNKEKKKKKIKPTKTKGKKRTKKKRKKRRKEIPIVTKKPKKKKEKKKRKQPVRKKEEKKKTEKPKKINPTKNKVRKDNNAVKVKKEPIQSIYRDEYKGSYFKRRVKRRTPPVEKNSFFSFQFGQSNYLGDLGGGSRSQPTFLGDLDFKENTFFYGFSYSQIRKEALGLRLSYVFGKIAASDKNTFVADPNDPSYSRYLRNLDFQTTINEGSLMVECYPFKFLSYQSKLHNSYFQPYALLGIGRYSFNPQGSIYDPILEENVWVDLQPLALEGQGMSEYPDRKPYKLSQWNMPYGFGMNYEISRTVTVGLEYVSRKLGTDYLDDVSTNYIDPKLFDKYLTPENAELAKILNNKSRLIDASREYQPGQKRGNTNNKDLYFSISGRLIINLGRKKGEKKPLFKYDDYEICE